MKKTGIILICISIVCLMIVTVKIISNNDKDVGEETGQTIEKEIFEKINIISNSKNYCDSNSRITYIDSCLYLSKETSYDSLSTDYKALVTIISMFSEENKTDIADKELPEDSPLFIGDGKFTANYVFSADSVVEKYNEIFGEELTKKSLDLGESNIVVEYNKELDNYYVACYIGYNPEYSKDSIIKTETIDFIVENDYVYVDVAVAFLMNYDDGYLIYSKHDAEKNFDSILYEELNDYKIDLENKETYTSYRYKFEKDGENYRFISVEEV